MEAILKGSRIQFSILTFVSYVPFCGYNPPPFDPLVRPAKMAFLPFKNEIFLGYAQVNDRVPPDSNEGWVTRFLKDLDYELSQRFARPGDIKIWRDKEELGGNTTFNDEIKENINQSGLFLALTSLGYLSPESYCHKELSWFYNKARKEPYGLKIENRSRIINVLLENIDPGGWLPEMKDMSGFSFHDATQRGQISHRLQPGTELYKKRMEALVDHLVLTLNLFKSHTQAKPLNPPQQNPGAFKIFLAHTEGSLTVKRDRYAQELQRKGFEVVTNIPPPFGAAEHEKTVANAIANAGLCIHMFDEGPGNRIEGEQSQTYYRKQFELGVKSGKRQLICVPNAFELEADSDHGQFMHKLEHGPRSGTNYTFLRQNEPALVTPEVLQEIDKIRGKQNDAGTQFDALLDAHVKDFAMVPEVNEVFSKRGLTMLINAASDEPQESVGIFDKLREGLKVLVIALGHVSDLWASHRLNLSLKVALSSLKLCAIYAPPINGLSRPIDLSVFQVPPGKFRVVLCFKLEHLESALDEHLESER